MASHSKIFFPLSSFKTHSLSWNFSNLSRLFDIILFWALWSLWFMVWCLILMWEILGHYCFNFFFFSFPLIFSPPVFPLHLCYNFLVAVQFLDILLFFNLFFLFSDFKGYWHILYLKDFFLSHIQSSNGPIKSILQLLLLCFSSLAFLYGSFFRISISLLTNLSIYFCIVSTLSIRAFIILIIVA